MTVHWPTLDAFLGGKVTFEDVGQLFSDLCKVVFEHENFSSIWSAVTGFFANFGAIVAIVCLVLSLVETFFGSRIIGVQKFLFFFGIGFASGASLLAPVIASAGIGIPPWIVGLVIGAVGAVFAKILYLVLYVFFSGYATYMMFMGGQLIPATLTSFSVGNMVLALVSAVIVIILMLLFRHWVEKLLCSALGAYTTALCVRWLCGGLNNVIFLVIFILFTVLGFVVQAKIRRKRRR